MPSVLRLKESVMTVAIPYDWLQRLPRELLPEGTPLFGYPPDFPWEEFSALFTKIFKLSSCSFVLSPWELKDIEKLYEGFGSERCPLYVEFASLEGALCLLFADADVNRLMNLLLLGDSEATTLIDFDYRKGFLDFMALEVLSICKKLEYAKHLQPHLVNEMLFSKPSFCSDLTFTINKETFVVRLIISRELQESWRMRYAERKLKVELPLEISSKIQTIVHLEAGHVSLSKEEWDQAKIGDCLLLDDCSLASEEKGRIILTLNGSPLFRAKVKDGNLKILESPFFQKISVEMTPTLNVQPQPVHKKQEAPVSDTFDEEFSDFDEDFTEFDEDLDEETDTVDEETSEELEKEEENVAEPPSIGTASEAPQKQVTPAAKEPIHLSQIPLNIVIEIGRIQISMQKLLELKPGDLLELDIHPEDSIDLVLQGNVIAKGELLKIGDSLGVRILDKV